MTQHCCESIAYHINYRCPLHPDPYDCADNILIYRPQFDEYGIIIHDGGASAITIRYCPFCGAKLRDSKRDLWFDRLEALGIEDPADCPEEMTDDRWWRLNPKESQP
ncbi:MAG: hypothetical protein LAT64_09135 [Phycisphaerales bacterium]|nr:hypothetical protein [Planctomycetota bacterium]MCH8508912.1 hypothetical protein [Phycisphaerales bacterium]